MRNPIIISFGGGKGGIGKSTIVSNIGAVLVQKGYSVGFIDADLGGANLHLFLGIKRPRFSLQDYLSGRIKYLEDIAEKTIIGNTCLISGASDILELVSPRFTQKQKIINNLKKLNADYILIDLGAGASSNVTDFFAAFNNGVVISDCLPTSIENAYSFLKNSIIRGLLRPFPGRIDIRNHFRHFSDPNMGKGFATMNEMLLFLNKHLPDEAQQMKEWLTSRKTFLALNMINNQHDIIKGKKFTEIIKKYLNLKLYYIGYFLYENEIKQSIRKMKPLMINNPSKKSTESYNAIVDNLITLTKDQRIT